MGGDLKKQARTGFLQIGGKYREDKCRCQYLGLFLCDSDSGEGHGFSRPLSRVQRGNEAGGTVFDGDGKRTAPLYSSGRA